VLHLQGLTFKNSHEQPVLKDISLNVCAGEILGIAGVDGNGQRELAMSIVGTIKPDQGTITIKGKNISGFSPRQIMHAGISHIPEDRQSMGLVLDFSVAENFILKNYNEKPFVNKGLLQPRLILEHASRLVRSFDIRTTSVKKPAGLLSGGNQQKIILGREIDKNPSMLLAVQPTRGLDVGATEYVHSQLLEQRARGAAILLISTELDEILALSDRIAVIYEGQIMGEMSREEADVNKIGMLMAGVKEGESRAYERDQQESAPSIESRQVE
jgi:general nucleoside transport system ATP-binding protein